VVVEVLVGCVMRFVGLAALVVVVVVVVVEIVVEFGMAAVEPGVFATNAGMVMKK